MYVLYMEVVDEFREKLLLENVMVYAYTPCKLYIRTYVGAVYQYLVFVIHSQYIPLVLIRVTESLATLINIRDSRDFLISADIKVFGCTYLFAMLLLLASYFFTPRCLCLAYIRIYRSIHI